MSRRSRKRAGKAGSSWLGRALLVSLILGILVVGGGYLGIRMYLHSDAFRLMLAQQTGKALKSQVEFGPFRWHGRQVRTDRVEADGDQLVSRLLAEGSAMEVGFGGFDRGVWELKGCLIRRLEAELDFTVPAEEEPERQSGPVGKSGGGGGWLPRKVEVVDAEISNMDLRAITADGVVSFLGVRALVESDGGAGSYLANLKGGVLQLPYEGVPAIELEQADLRIGKQATYLKSLKATGWGSALLTATGEWDKVLERGALDGRLSGVPTAKLLQDDWVRRVSGTVDLPFLLRMDGDALSAEGEVRLENGVLTALPILDVLAAYADTRRFRVMPLHEARCEWRWRNETMRLSNIVLHSEGLSKLEGNLVIRGGELDGVFRLGIPPGTLAHIPGAETVVFVPGENGLLWAPLRISGTIDDPQEDLSGRLIAAAGMRMFEELPETGEQVLRFSHRLAEEVAPKAFEGGLRVLDQGKGIVDDANEVLEGIFGQPLNVPQIPGAPKLPTPKLPLLPE